LAPSSESRLRFTAPMEAKSVGALPTGAQWQYEPKWDGFRCLAVKDGDSVRLFAKSGKRLDRYFPEIVAQVAALKAPRFVLDGELVLPADRGLSFDALQMRLHPAASRIKRLADETPALYVLFDLLVDGAQSWRSALLVERRAALEAFVARNLGREATRGFRPSALRLRKAHGAGLRLSAATRRLAEAQRWLDTSGGTLDGLIAKPLDRAYVSGERAMLKYKRLRTADCVVGGFRYATAGRLVGSLLLGLYDAAGKLHHVGFTSSIPVKERQALTTRLEALRKAPGFTGDAPGGPSRWSTERSAQWEPLAPKLVVEVSYDQVTGDRFRHGTKLLRWRPDKAPRQCTFEQIAPIDT
jgi:ATP-dependent DNA ligase